MCASTLHVAGISICSRVVLVAARLLDGDVRHLMRRLYGHIRDPPHFILLGAVVVVLMGMVVGCLREACGLVEGRRDAQTHGF